MLKRMIAVAATLALTATAAMAAAESYTIGIGQFAEHGSLDNCRTGFIEGLAEAGLVEGDNLTVIYQNAQADMGVAQQIAAQFAAKPVDLMVGIATPMAQACYNAAGDIPTIFTAVSDPVSAGFADADGKAVGEVTGTSDALPVAAQLATIRALLPDAKKIGILYTTSEVNSLSTIETYKSLAPGYGFEIVESGISTAADIPLALDALLGKVDCLTNLTDNTVVSALALVLDKANAAGKPVFGSEIEQVKLGCVAAEGLDYVALGRQTGLMAAKVLKGEVKASDMAYEVISDPSLYVNAEALARFGITLSDDLAARAKKFSLPEGIQRLESLQEGYPVTDIRVTGDGARTLGKPAGRYITVDLTPCFQRQQAFFHRAVWCIAYQLRALLPHVGRRSQVLVVGLGNRAMTPDAIGPIAVENLLVTRHMVRALPRQFQGFTPVSALCTGVLARTGLETLELIQGAAAHIRPAAVIAIDALAARSRQRLCATVQLSDTGLTPGSGVGNHRRAVDRAALGVPVIAVGVPTVIDGATLCADLLAEAGCPQQPLSGRGAALFVTPQDIDQRVTELGRMVGYAVTLALQRGLTLEDVTGLLG